MKLNGNVGRLDYGVLSAVESDYSDDLGRAFAGQRLRYASGPVTFGYLGTWVDRPFLDRSAQVHSGDFIWRPNSQLMLQGQVIGSLIDQAAEDTSGDGEILLAVYTPTPDWQHELGLTHYASTLDFNDMGFQQRASVNYASYLISRRFRDFDESDARASVRWRARPELRYNDSGERLGNYLGVFRESRRRVGIGLQHVAGSHRRRRRRSHFARQRRCANGRAVGRADSELSERTARQVARVRSRLTVAGRE